MYAALTHSTGQAILGSMLRGLSETEEDEQEKDSERSSKMKCSKMKTKTKHFPALR